jgi:hypothetical protein
LRAKTHFERQGQVTFPYVEKDEIEKDEDAEEAVDPVELAKFMNKTGRVIPSDSYASRSTDNQYYTPSASSPFYLSKLGEALSPNVSGTSIVPTSNLYKGKQALHGGAHSWNSVQKPIQHTKGTKMGYSMGSKLYDIEDFISDDEKNDEFLVVSKIRQIVNAYRDLNMLQK